MALESTHPSLSLLTGSLQGPSKADRPGIRSPISDSQVYNQSKHRPPLSPLPFTPPSLVHTLSKPCIVLLTMPVRAHAPPVIATAVLSVPTQTPTRTGPRSLISQNAVASRTGSPNATIVSIAQPFCFLFWSNHGSASNFISTGKKLKRRLEDLERRAASSASPEQSHAEPPPKATKTRSKQRANKADVKSHTLHTTQPETPVSYDYYTPDERNMFGQQCTRQLSASPPPVFSYAPLHTYDAYRPAYGQLPVYHSVPSTYGEVTSYPAEYGESLPSLVPMIPGHPPGTIRKPAYDEDIISPFSMSYASMAGIDLCSQPSQPQPGLPVHFPR